MGSVQEYILSNHHFFGIFIYFNETMSRPVRALFLHANLTILFLAALGFESVVVNVSNDDDTFSTNGHIMCLIAIIVSIMNISIRVITDSLWSHPKKGRY